MSRTRGFFKTYDQRTGRKIRGTDAVYDGELPSILVKRGEDDAPHPLSQPFSPGVDRVMLLPGRREQGSHTTNIVLGFEANTYLWQRDSVPCLRLGGGAYEFEVVPSPGGELDAFLLGDGTSGILLEDGSSDLLMES
jgi:hypothetical protein